MMIAECSETSFTCLIIHVSDPASGKRYVAPCWIAIAQAQETSPSMTGGRGAVVLRADLFVFSPVSALCPPYNCSVAELTNFRMLGLLNGEQHNSFADAHRHMGLAL